MLKRGSAPLSFLRCVERDLSWSRLQLPPAAQVLVLSARGSATARVTQLPGGDLQVVSNATWALELDAPAGSLAVLDADVRGAGEPAVSDSYRQLCTRTPFT